MADEIKSLSKEMRNGSAVSQKSNQAGSSPFDRISKTIHDEKVAKMQAQLKNNKTYMNMAVHDMRNPTNAITFGVNETLQMLKN